MTKRGRKTKKIAKAKDEKGYLDSNKDAFTDYKVIRGNKITMEGVSGQIYAIPIDKQGKAGKGRLMKSGENHTFDGAAHVIEIPETAMAQLGINTGAGINQQKMEQLGIQTLLPPNQPLGVGVKSSSTSSVDEQNRMLGNPNSSTLPYEEDAAMQEMDASIEQGLLDKEYLEKQAKEANAETNAMEDDWRTDLEEFSNQEVGIGGGNVVEPTEKIQFDNPYGGVDIPTSAQTLGASLSYDGDKKGANTARGIASGLKLLTGLGRNVMSGYAQNKRNQWVNDEYNRKQKNQLKGQTRNLQAGGDITDREVASINNTTGIDFTNEGANALFDRTPNQTPESAASLDFGKYSDVGYFEEGEMRNGKRVIYNTEANPMNYSDNKRNALEHLREVNGDTFEFQYRDRNQRAPQPSGIVSRQKGGKVSAAELLSGTVVTGDLSVAPNVETEEGEHIKDNRTGKVQEVVGNKHSQGGEKMNLEDHKVLSDYTKIGGDLAKKYRDEFDIKVKAKDTYATVMDKVLKKTGYKSITDELTSTIEKTEKEQEKAKDRDSEATTGINMQHLSGKINDLTKELEPLESLKSSVFETLFNDQQGSKSSKELSDEGEQMQTGGEKKIRFEEGDNPNQYTNPDAQPLTNEERYIAGTVNDENYKETVLQLLEEFPNLVQENFEIIQGVDGVEDIKPRNGQDSIVQLQQGINEVYDAKIAEAENITDPVTRERIIERIQSEKFNNEERYKATDGLIGNFTASRRNFSLEELSGEAPLTETTPSTTSSTTPSQEVEGDNGGTGNRVALLPDQHILPPSTMQPHRLSEITPREAEVKLISPDAQIAEINRQFMTAKSEINSLPDSQRRAALAQLNSQTQQSINQVMSQTNRANAQIEGQNEERNIQRASQTDMFNEQAADVYEKKQLTAKDKTEQDIRNYFNAQNKKQVANYNTIQNMNLTNAMYDNFQYDGNGSIIQTGKAPDKDALMAALNQAGLTEEDLEEAKKRATKKAKRGRKIK